MSLPTKNQPGLEMPGFTTENGHIPVRDRRNKNWHWKLNRLHDEFPHEQSVVTFAAIIGASACLVYDYLCRRADEETQTCFPSVPTVAFITGLGETTAGDMLSVLGWHGMIQRIYREADEGDPTSNLYILLPSEMWSVEGGKAELKDTLAKKQRDRLQKLLGRKIPYALRKKYFPVSKVSVEVVQNLTHPPQKNAPRVVQVLTHPGLEYSPPLPQNLTHPGPESDPLLDQDSFVPDSGVVNTQPNLLPLAPMSVDDENFPNSDLAPSAQVPPTETPQNAIAQKLAEFAQTREVKATSNELTAIVEKWPAAKLRDDQLADALVRDYELYGLDKSVDEPVARQAVKTDAAQLRWFLCAWRGFEEASDEYHEQTKHRWTKTGCFIKRWQKSQPPATWLEWELRNLRRQQAVAAEKARDQEAQKFWESLSPAQKRRLNHEVKVSLEEESKGEYLGANEEAKHLKRQELLLDPETREWLTQTQEATERAPSPSDQVVVSEPVPVSQLNLEVYIGPILADVRGGLLEVEDLDERRIKILEDEEWEEVKTAIVERLAA